jgi:uncharacterized Zn finger protein
MKRALLAKLGRSGDAIESAWSPNSRSIRRHSVTRSWRGFSHDKKTELLAGKLERSHLEIAAGVYRALCMRIVNAGKSKYYHAALDNMKQAKKCYAKAGLKADWEALVADIRERHSRKRGFMSGFDQIVSDTPRRVEPTFLERAQTRWQRVRK